MLGMPDGGEMTRTVVTTIDFENNAIPTGWTNTNSMAVVSNPIPNSSTSNGSYCLSTNGKQSCSLTSGLFVNVVSVSIDASRTSNNTVTNLYIDFSTDENFSANNTQSVNVTNIPKNAWASTTLTLPQKANGYVRIRWSGNSTAVKYIDNIEIACDEGPSATPTTTLIDNTNLTNLDLANGTNAGYLTAEVYDENDNPITGATVTWSSSDNNIANVDANGNVALVSTGPVTITAEYAGVTGQYQPSDDTYSFTVVNTAPYMWVNPYQREWRNETAESFSIAYYNMQNPAPDNFSLVYYTDNTFTTIASAPAWVTMAIAEDNGDFNVEATNITANTTGTSRFIYYKVNYNNGGTIVESNGVEVSQAPSYVLTIAPMSNISLTILNNLGNTVNSGGRVAYFSEVILEPVPTTGYTLGSLAVTYVDNNQQQQTVSLTDNQDGTYSFYMPEYDVTVSATAQAPMTVAEALDPNNTYPMNDVYVTGVISRITEEATSNYFNVSYYISSDGSTSSDELYVYRGKYLNGDPYNQEGLIAVGDEVVIYGNVINYQGTIEFAQNNYITSLIHVEAPTFSPASGTYSTLQTVTLSCSTTGANIYYTMDGSEPTAASTLYSAPIANVPFGTTIKARAFVGNAFSAVASATYETTQSISIGIVGLGISNIESFDFGAMNLTDITPADASDFSFAFYDYNTGAAVSAPSWFTPGVYSQVNGLNETEYYVYIYDIDDNANGSFRDVNMKVVYTPTGVESNAIYIWQYPSYALTVTQNQGVAQVALEAVIPDGSFVTKQSGDNFTAIGEVHITPTAATGYAITGVTYTCSNQSPATETATDEGNGVYSFYMPQGATTVDITVEQAVAVNYSVNGVAQQVSVAPSSFVLPTSADLNNDFVFAGWTTDPNDVSNIIAAGTVPTTLTGVTFYAVYARQEATGTVNCYERVTSAQSDWAGDYLIAYDDETFADGRIGGTSTNGIGGKDVSVDLSEYISNNQIPVANGDTYHVTLEAITEGGNTFVLKTQDGKYNYQTSNSNGLASTDNKSTAANYPITVTFTSANDIKLALGGNATGAVFRYNSDGYFRFYKNGGQEAVYLYKKVTATQYNSVYYTRVFMNETATADITIAGPSIVPSGYYLNMHENASTVHNFVNSTTANFVVEDGAAFYGGTIGGDNANGIAKKNITGYGTSTTDNYVLIASPFDNLNPAATVAMTNMLTGNYDLYKYDQSETEEWVNYKDQTSGSFYLNANNGYLYANSADMTLEFRGQLNSANNQVPLVNNQSADMPGWNLIGNSRTYPATIAQPYYRLNADGNGLNATTESTAINPMEGVFVHYEPTMSQTVTFTMALPTTGGNSEPETEQINISVSRNRGASTGSAATLDNAIVRFDGGAMLGKFRLNDNATELYMLQGGKEMAIVSAQAQGEMPVSFKAAENGTYTLSVEVNNVEMNYLHLIDNMTGADVDLLATPSYTFEAKTSDYASRFRLVFSANSISEDADGDNAFAYFNGSNWTISNMGEATLQVVDVMGRVISSEQINGNTEININQPAGVYMLRLVSGDSVKVQKVVVR